MINVSFNFISQITFIILSYITCYNCYLILYIIIISAIIKYYKKKKAHTLKPISWPTFFFAENILTYFNKYFEPWNSTNLCHILAHVRLTLYANIDCTRLLNRNRGPNWYGLDQVPTSCEPIKCRLVDLTHHTLHHY